MGEIGPSWLLSNGATPRAQVTILAVYPSKDKHGFGEINLSASTKTFADTTVTSGGSVNQTSSLKVSPVTLHRTDIALGYFETNGSRNLQVASIWKRSSRLQSAL